MWNLVGFQTRLRSAEKNACATPAGAPSSCRYGSITATRTSTPPARCRALSVKATGAVVAGSDGRRGLHRSAARGSPDHLARARGRAPLVPPPTRCWRLYRYLREADPAHFQPMNANFGLAPSRSIHRSRTGRKSASGWRHGQWRSSIASRRGGRRDGGGAKEDRDFNPRSPRKNATTRPHNGDGVCPRDVSEFADFLRRGFLRAPLGLGRRRSPGHPRVPRRVATARASPSVDRRGGCRRCARSYRF